MNCRICGNADNNQVYQAREMMLGLRDSFDYMECAQCGCLQILQVPTDIEKYYPQRYYSFQIDPLRYFNNPAERLARRFRDSYAVFNRSIIGGLLFKKFPDWSLHALAHIDVTKESKILDVGCGRGFLLYSLKNMGFKHIRGVDPNLPADIRYLNGLSIQKSELAEVSGEWDVIMFHHSFEHIADPAQTLKLTRRLLCSGGVCILRIPIVSSYAWRHFKTDWVQLDAPRHFFLHSVRSIELLVAQVGLRLEKTIYDSTEFQFWGSEQYQRDIPLMAENSYGSNPSRAVFTSLQIRAFKEKARQLNEQGLGDSAAFYLRKTAA